MTVKAVKSFAGMAGNKKYRVTEGDVFDLPSGTDWLKAGLVEPVAEPKKTTTRKTTAKAKEE